MSHPYRIPNADRKALLERLFDRVRAGDRSAVRTLIGDDPSLVHDYDPDPWCCRSTPLNAAIDNGDLEMAETLLDLGADPNQKSAWWAGGYAPLHCVHPDRHDLSALLESRGAVVDIHAAAALDRIERLVELLDHDPHWLEMPGGDGGRPLHYAASAATAQVLVDRGAQIEPLDVDHASTPAQWAIRDRQDVTRLLLEHGAAPDLFMLTALGDRDAVQAWIGDQPDSVNRPLSKADFNSPGSEGGHIYAYTLTGYGTVPLHVAARFGHVELLSDLVGAGADPGSRGGYDDQTPLHAAASTDQAEAVRRLASLGADVNAPSGDIHETPPITWAIVFGCTAAVAALIEVGAAVTPGVVRSAKAGAAGEFQQYSDATLHDWAEILTLVEAVASG